MPDRPLPVEPAPDRAGLASPGPYDPPDPLDLLGVGRPGPGRSLPPWVVAVRDRVGLDARAVAWVAVAIVAVAGAAWLLRPAPAPLEETLPMASSTPAGGTEASAGATTTGPGASTGSVPTELVVHAAGAVVRPGVYPLAVGARVDDLVVAAGGLAPDADPARLNLAAPLTDGARIYVPRTGEAEAPAVVSADEPTGGAGAGAPGPAGGEPGGDTGPIDLNTADEATLDELPGVGPAIAAAIVAFREENGAFASVDELLDVRGIGEAKMAELRPLVAV